MIRGPCLCAVEISKAREQHAEQVEMAAAERQALETKLRESEAALEEREAVCQAQGQAAEERREAERAELQQALSALEARPGHMQRWV